MRSELASALSTAIGGAGDGKFVGIGDGIMSPSGDGKSVGISSAVSSAGGGGGAPFSDSFFRSSNRA